VALKSPESVLRSALIANSSVAALAGSRIYPIIAPATAVLPFITWRRSAIRREQTLSGPMGTPTVTVELQMYGTTYEEVRDMADKVRHVLDGYGGTADNTTVNQAALVNESDGFETLAGADLPIVYQVTQTYDVLWQEI
jgi:hypothetical protein